MVTRSSSNIDEVRPTYHQDTKAFISVIEQISKLGVLFKITHLSKLLGVNPKTIRKWEKAGLIFPSRDSYNNRIFYAKDVFRGITLKYLINYYKIKDLRGVGLLLSLTDKLVTKVHKHKKYVRSINKEAIDRYLMKQLRYSVNDAVYVNKLDKGECVDDN